MLAVYGSIVPDRSAAYCSAPITTGRRNIEWQNRLGVSFAELDDASEQLVASHAEQVIAPNLEHARVVVERIRHLTQVTLIDPTAVPPQPGWTQLDWRAFWTAVIERYVATVYFIDGWEFSNGCALEFLVATRSGARTYDERMQEIGAFDGVYKIREAVGEIARRNGHTTFLADVATRLEHGLP